MNIVFQVSLTVLVLISMISSWQYSNGSYTISEEYKAISFNNRQRFLVMHYTALNLKKSLRVLTGKRVSSHYVVPKGPINNMRKIYRLVPEDKRAWTQGVSSWGSRNNLNDQGVSLEIVNRGFVRRKKALWFPYPQYQIESVIQISKDIIRRYNIKPTNVIGHSDVSPGRKVDPGPLFPWKCLYENGVGAWPDSEDVKYFLKLPEPINLKTFQKNLRKYGYNVNTNGTYTKKTRVVVKAFQMHFRPTNYKGVVDKETNAILQALVKKYF